MTMARRLTQEQFLEKARLVCGDKYTFENAVYVRSSVPLIVTCPTHGDFSISSNNLLFGKGCPACAKITRGKSKAGTAAAVFVSRSMAVHKGKYSYENAQYVAAKKPITVTCPEHGDFITTPDRHLRGVGCQKCADEARTVKKTMTQGEFIALAQELHAGRYSYEKTLYVRGTKKVEIICPVHGSFWQTPANHIQGNGCELCGKEETAKKLRVGVDEFLRRARDAHGDSYDYSQVTLTNLKDKVEILCSTHGEFTQQANAHLRGSGCPSCSHSVSLPENALTAIFQEAGLEVVRRDRELLREEGARYAKEIDLVIPEIKLGIEYCGVWWHSDANGKDKRYHVNKLELCENKGYRLVTIFEDEYVLREDQTTRLLKKIAGITRPVAIPARKCVVREIGSVEANALFEAHHVQGKAKAQHYYGLIYDGVLVAAAALSKHRVFMGGEGNPDSMELVRFCTLADYVVLGGAGKLVTFAKKEHSLLEVVSYVDRRWFTGSGYRMNGFAFTYNTEPNYWYVKGQKRISRYTYAKHLLANKYEKGELAFYDANLSEAEIMRLNGFNRIYDCGNMRFAHLA